jgi:4-hydroxythreonine-4-phosphate dehydrogenase
VVHVTTHQSLRSACEIDVPRVVETLRVGRIALHRLIGAEPRVAVCGLNPHAGESGLFGDEDARVIKPAVEIALTEGMNVTGPLPADTVFLQAVRGRFDLVIAMYHDQGHIPMKLIDFEHTVNVSLNLPIVRTSVDHGTAYDIAGNNLADPTSMKSAMRLALKLASGCRSSVGNPLDRRMK